MSIQFASSQTPPKKSGKKTTGFTMFHPPGRWVLGRLPQRHRAGRAEFALAEELAIAVRLGLCGAAGVRLATGVFGVVLSEIAPGVGQRKKWVKVLGQNNPNAKIGVLTLKNCRFYPFESQTLHNSQKRFGLQLFQLVEFERPFTADA